MKHFTKYIPVKGHFHYVGAVIQHKDGSLATIKKVGEDLDETEWQYVKLMLCSRDVKVGDEYYKNGRDKTLFGIYSELSPECFKVVGEISPDAIWVRENDEFDEVELLYEYKHRSFRDKDFVNGRIMPEDRWEEGEKEKYTLRIQIKCPTCQTFH